MSQTGSATVNASGCPCFESLAIPTAGGTDTLVLAAMDSDADGALVQALAIAGIEYHRRGPAIVVYTPNRNLAPLNSLASTLLPAPLQARIKAVFADEETSTDTILAAFLQAEPLPTFFEQSEVAWVRDALREDWLFSVFHPIIDAQTGEEYAYEALIRAKHPSTGEVLGAGQLIFACNKLNLQHQLDQQARVSAIRGAAALNKPGARFFINFLPGAIFDPARSLQTTLESAAEYHIETSQLVFEVVETEEIENPGRLRRILEYYREKGVGIALDDIGSGFSSLHYLSELQPDYVKIDRHIVATAATSSGARHTLESIVELSKKLNAKVVGEGIETLEQMDICINAGVDYLQGFLFAMPANPPHKVSKHLFTKIAA